MSHEAAHVATDAATSALPLWLLEGFADYVALRDVPTCRCASTAGQIIRAGPPRRRARALPGAGEFDTATTHLGAAYEAAWLACRLLAERGASGGLVRFYRRARRRPTSTRRFGRLFGFGEPELHRGSWRASLTDLAA